MSGTIEINGQAYKVTLTPVTPAEIKKVNEKLEQKVEENVEMNMGNKKNNNNINMNMGNKKNNNIDMNLNYNIGGGKKKGKKASKGTRKLSPYMKFAQEARKNIIAQNPELKSDIIAVGKKIGEQWRALSAEEKAKY